MSIVDLMRLLILHDRCLLILLQPCHSSKTRELGVDLQRYSSRAIFYGAVRLRCRIPPESSRERWRMHSDVQRAVFNEKSPMKLVVMRS